MVIGGQLLSVGTVLEASSPAGFQRMLRKDGAVHEK
jgi:hypothetical protein